jgi:phosphoribosylaminoimidazole-succinocarboxamide synthase
MQGWIHQRSGKVREIYSPADTSQKEILLVASDRISAFDYILPTVIPNKGALLTQLSLFWFDFLRSVVPNHLLDGDIPEEVRGRAILVEPLQMFPVECVVRGYLTGSGWAEYQQTQSVCGVPLPAGLVDGSRLPHPIFTPATKAEDGEHDINITFDQMVEIIGLEPAQKLRELSIAIYSRAHDYAFNRGVIIADTKFEFGYNHRHEITLGDEVLTPDSSRFWDVNGWQPGGSQPSYDKQFVRDWLLQSGWDKNSTPPALPADVVEKTSARYERAFELITGRKFYNVQEC